MKRRPMKRRSRKFVESLEAMKEFRRIVQERDQHCQAPLCHKRECDVHHVRPKSRWPDLKANPDNGLLLCREHHEAWHRASHLWLGWWKQMFPERWRNLIDTSRKRAHTVGAVGRKEEVNGADEDGSQG